MTRASPPRGYAEREPRAYPVNPPPSRRPPRKSRGDRLAGLLLELGTSGLVIGACLFFEILLLLVALIPQTTWATLGYPNGPIPTVLSPVVAGAFYVLPTLTGALCRRWQMAVVLATLPAWLDLGVFAIAAATRIGPFYLETDPHSDHTVGTLELFFLLGALGWLARSSLVGVLKRRKGNQL